MIPKTPKTPTMHYNPHPDDRLIISFQEHEKVAVTVVEDDTGTLVCNCAEARTAVRHWCGHIEEIVRTGLDACPPGTDAKVALAAMPEKVVVPIVPTQDFWMIVGLGPVEDGFRKAEIAGGAAYRSSGPASSVRMPTIKQDMFLGYIGTHEGRLAMRTLVLEWLRPFYYHPDMRCYSRLHRVARWSKSDKRDRPLGPEDWASLWCIISEQKCKACATYTTDWAQDAPRL